MSIRRRFRVCLSLLVILCIAYGTGLAQYTLFYDDFEGFSNQWEEYRRGKKKDDLKWEVVFDPERGGNVMTVDASSLDDGIRTKGSLGSVGEQLIVSLDVKGTSNLGFLFGMQCRDDRNGTFCIEYHSSKGKHKQKDDKVLLYLGNYKNKKSQWVNVLQDVKEDILSAKDNIYSIHSVEFIYFCGDVRVDNVQILDSPGGMYEPRALESTDPTSIIGALSVGFQSPNAASLGKFGDIPVSHYTGAPNINIPIYELRSRHLSLPINLRYHASGNKVEEIPGWVGLGWTLEAGGVITRTVRGLPDETPNGYCYTGEELENTYTWPDVPTSEENTFFEELEQETLDPQPDAFFFNFAQYSGKVILKPFVNGVEETIAYTMPHKKWLIEYTLVDNVITKWTIRTEDGIRYTFEELEQTNEVKHVETKEGESDVSDSYPDYISSWYLTGIVSPQGDDTIELQYTSFYPGGISYESQSYEERFGPGYSLDPDATFNTNFFKTYSEYTVSNTRLSSITTTTEEIQFISSRRSHQLTTDPDNPSYFEHQLDEIEIYRNGALIKTFELDYSYFTGSDPRLRLDSVKEVTVGGNEIPPYIFTYNSTAFPSRLSYAMDHWGFFNGKVNNTLIPEFFIETESVFIRLDGADRTSNENTSQIGMLQGIQYPTGGSTSFLYEAHDYSRIGDEDIPAEYGPVQTTDNYIQTTTGYGESSTSFNVEGDLSTDARGKLTIKFTALETYDPEQDDSEAGIVKGAEKISVNVNEVDFSDPDGGYIYATLIFYPKISVGEYKMFADIASAQLSAEVECEWNEWDEDPIKKGAGGLRIVEIRDRDGVSPANDIVRTFQYTSADDPIRSSGVLVSEPVYGHETKIFDAQTEIGSLLTRSCHSYCALGMTQGSHIGYREVRVSTVGDGSEGYTYYVYRSPDQRPDDNESALSPILGQRTNYDWERGQLEEQHDYDDEDQAVKRMVNTYHYPSLSPMLFKLAAKAFSTKVLNNILTVHTTDATHNPVSYNVTVRGYSAYQMISAWLYPEQEVTTYFGENDREAALTKSFEFDSDHLLLKQSTETNSDGMVRETKFKYAHEQYSSMASDTVHMFSQVYSTTISDGAGDEDSKKWTVWSNSDGWWRPREEWVWESTSDDDTVPSNPGVGVAETKQVAVYDDYDDYGNLLQATDGRGNFVKYYFGSNDEPFRNVAGDLAGVYLTGIQRVSETADEIPGDWSRPTGGDDLFVEARYDYDWNQISEIINENEQSTHFTYDSFGRLIETAGPDNTILTQTIYEYSVKDPDFEFDLSNPNFIRHFAYSSGSDITQTTNFFDGLGREIQTQIKVGSDDIISAIDYDSKGRAWKQWKPYLRSGGLGAFDTDHGASANAYYDGSNYRPNCSGYAYTETQYYDDPLDRVYQVGNPGSDFRIGSGHEVETTYDINDVSIFIDGEKTYTSEQLTITTVRDENGTDAVEYTDSFGNTVCQVTDPPDPTGLNLKTGYRYDILGNPTHVYPPNAYAPPDGSVQADWLTEMTYNTLGQMTQKETPDAGTVKYKYDVNGNLRFVQDQKHAAGGRNLVFYTYDAFNRVNAVGEVLDDTPPLWADLDPDDTGTFEVEAYYKVLNQYDTEADYGNDLWTDATDPGDLQNLKGRLCAVAYKDENSGLWGYTYYSYDVYGNVEMLVQDLPGAGLGMKTFSYAYDLQGRVTKMSYQAGQSDAFHAWYAYDALGSLASVKTNTTDDEGSAQDAVDYDYWPTLAVKRMVLGGNVQGMDYVYNPRDWLLQINHQNLSAAQDPGGDGPGGTSDVVNLDRFGLVMGYNSLSHIGSAYGADAQYNGNISWLIWKTYGNSEPWSLVGYAFDYDNASRLTDADFGYYSSSWQTTLAGDAKSFTFDPNGNIKTLKRWEMTSSGLAMDDLAFNYNTGTNTLEFVDDLVADAVSDRDMDDQDAGNYLYDANGNLTQDLSKDINSVTYDFQNLPYELAIALATSQTFQDIIFDFDRTYQAKQTIMAETGTTVQSGTTVAFRAGSEIRLKPGFHAEYGSNFSAEIDADLLTATNQEVEFAYDATGNRVSKVSDEGEDYYIRDAAGNVFATYDDNGTCDQIYLFGNDLIGDFSLATGNYRYYLKDHLGSIRTTVEEDGSVADFYDYYPFGFTLRSQNSAQGSRFKFTEKELDGEAGVDWYYFGARYYDSSIGRWLTTDPAANEHLNVTPYHYCFNNPIRFIDPVGLDTLQINLPQDRTQEGTMTLIVNGQQVELIGGNQVLGLSRTNDDPTITYGNTPTGTATVTTTEVVDRDTEGNFVNRDGTPVGNVENEPSKKLQAQGRFYIFLDPESGELLNSGRTQIGIHGGGTDLGPIKALQAQQPLIATRGCPRVTNQAAAQIASQVIDATKNKRVFRVIITQANNQ